MDMTAWLEYFTAGLAVQMGEVVDRGGKVIKLDALARKHGLSERQRKALGLALEQGGLTIKDYESLCPEVTRRTLQREIKDMIVKKILIPEGATNRLYYRLRKSKA
jgi:hypothetical protein